MFRKKYNPNGEQVFDSHNESRKTRSKVKFGIRTLSQTKERVSLTLTNRGEQP